MKMKVRMIEAERKKVEADTLFMEASARKTEAEAKKLELELALKNGGNWECSVSNKICHFNVGLIFYRWME